MKKKVKVVLILILLIAGFVAIQTKIVTVPQREQPYSEFWKQTYRYDVWLMGTSHMYYGVYPLELYEQFGISSYNIGAPSSFLPQTYWTLKCALEKGSNPDVLVVDVYHVHQDYKLVMQPEKVNTGLASIPFSWNKISAINDMMGGKDLKTRLSYMLPYSIFNEQRMVDNYSIAFNTRKGCNFKPKIYSKLSMGKLKKTDYYPDTTLGYDYLEKIIKLCQKKDINLVLTAWPAIFRKSKEAMKGMNVVEEYAKKYNVPFINSCFVDGLFDLETDIADWASHLNPKGAAAATKYLGKYLKKKYELTDYRKTDDKTHKYWEKSLDDYTEQFRLSLSSCDSLPSYLLCLTDGTYRAKIFRGTNFKNTPLLKKLIKAVPNRVNINRATAERYAKNTEGKLIGDTLIAVFDTRARKYIDVAQFRKEKMVSEIPIK